MYKNKKLLMIMVGSMATVLFNSNICLSKTIKENNVVIMSENEYGIHTGDVIESHYLTEKGDVKSVNIKVVGTFNDGERIAGIVQYSPSENMSYNSFYISVEVVDSQSGNGR